VGSINVNKLVFFGNIMRRGVCGSLGLLGMIILKWILHCRQFMTLSLLTHLVQCLAFVLTVIKSEDICC